MQGITYYVAVDGTANGDGSMISPWDLQTALDTPVLTYADTILLMAGTYLGTFTCHRSGGNNLYPITYKNAMGETATIDGQLICSEGDIRFISDKYGLIFTDSSFTDRESEEETAGPSDINGVTTLLAAAGSVRAQFINCIFRNGRQGMTGGMSAEQLSFYGCLFYFNGWKSPTNSYGHGAYPQNTLPWLTFEQCVFYDNFGYGLHAFASSGLIDYINIVDCTFFNNGSLWGQYWGNIHYGGVPFSDARIIGNWSYFNTTTDQGGVGVGDENSVRLFIEDNIFVGGRWAFTFAGQADSLQNNQFYGTVVGVDAETYPNNIYGLAGEQPDIYQILPNDHDSDLAILRVLNPAQKINNIIDVSALFGQSGTIAIHNLQDQIDDIQTLEIANGQITINMQAINRTVEIPTGWTVPATTFPKFGAFRLEYVP